MKTLFAIALLQSAVMGMKMTILGKLRQQDPEDFKQVKPDLKEEPVEERLPSHMIGSANHGFD